MIRFGTSAGAVSLRRDFTFDNVRLAAQAIADYLNSDSPIFLTPTSDLASPSSSSATTPDFSAASFRSPPAKCWRRAASFPCSAIATRPRRHRPHHSQPESDWRHQHDCKPQSSRVSGIEIFDLQRSAGDAGCDEANRGEYRPAPGAEWSFKAAVVGTFQCKTFDPQPAYFRQLRKLIDFAAIKRARLKVAVELMYGTGRGYLDRLLEEAGATVTVFHDELNPLFGGHHPERTPKAWPTPPNSSAAARPSSVWASTATRTVSASLTRAARG